MSASDIQGCGDILALERIATSLRERRDRLSGELARLTEPPEQGAGIGFGKRVGDGTSEAVERISTTATARSIAASIGEIDIALQRFEKGKYGVCEVCGGPIPAERLEALPATSTCMKCATPH
ncbi:MAG: TraR/DksA family transcriptional regulator [Acidimicrobiia bacterium]